MFERQCQTEKEKIKAEAYHKLVSKSSELFLEILLTNVQQNAKVKLLAIGTFQRSPPNSTSNVM